MTARAVAASELPQLVPELLDGTSVVALVPVDQADPWAADVAWALARTACGTRRVALVDACVERPALDRGAAQSGDEGLVDAFEFGSSLSHVAREQEPELFYIPAGTSPSDRVAVWENTRWQRLQRGFASQGAILFLFLPPQALEHLAIQPDAVVLLARSGEADPELVRRAVAVIQETVPGAAPPRRPGARWRAAGLGVASVAVAAGATYWFVLRPRAVAPPAAEIPAEPVAAVPLDTAPSVLDPVDSLPAEPEPSPLDESPLGDSLTYSLQVAAFDQMVPALALTDTLDEAGFLSYVTPVRIGNPARLWYRVMVGAYPSVDDARTTRAQLWDARLLRADRGTILRTPRTLEVAAFLDADSAASRRAGLRQEGVPGYIVAGPNGVFRLLVGAFEQAAQAEDAASLLLAAGYRGTLVPRIGIAR